MVYQQMAVKPSFKAPRPVDGRGVGVRGSQSPSRDLAIVVELQGQGKIIAAFAQERHHCLQLIFAFR